MFRPASARGPDADGGLRGAVIDATGAPVAGAAICCTDPLGTQQTVTDVGGHYHLPRHPSGRPRLEVRAPAHGDLVLERMWVLEPMVIALGRMVRTRIRAVDAATGQPIVGRLYVATTRLREPYASEPLPLPQLATDDGVAGGPDGAFEVAVDEYGSHCQITAPGYGRADFLANGAGDTRVELQRTQMRMLRVVDQDGARVLGARLLERGEWDREAAVAGIAAADGRLPVPAADTRLLRFVAAAGHGTAALPASLLQDIDAADGPCLRLPPEQRVRGVVRTPTGQPLCDAEVRAETGRTGIRVRTATDAEGRFELRGFPSGVELRVEATHPLWSSISKSAVPDGALVLTLDPPVLAELHLAAVPAPAEGPIVVQHFLGDQPGGECVATVDASGALRHSLPSDLGELSLGTRTLRSPCTGVLPATVLDLQPPRVVTGCVVDPDGRPVPGAEVSEVLEGAVSRWRSTAFTDADGRFRLVTCEHLLSLRVWHPTRGFGASTERATRGAPLTEDHYHIVLRQR